MSEQQAEYKLRAEYNLALELEQVKVIAATAADELAALNTVMPCGHLAQYFYPPDETDDTKRFCTICELYAVSFSDDKINTYSKGPG